MKQPAKWFCDFCGREITERQINRHIHVLKNAEPEEGRACTPYISEESYDICDKCYLQISNVAAGPRGENPYFIFKHISADEIKQEGK